MATQLERGGTLPSVDSRIKDAMACLRQDDPAAALRWLEEALDPEQSDRQPATDALVAEAARWRDEVQLLRELVAEATGTTLAGVAELVRLHRLERMGKSRPGRQPWPVQVPAILAAMETGAWMTTTDVTELVMPEQVRSMTRPYRTAFRGEVGAALHALEGEGQVEKRVTPDHSPDAFKRAGAKQATRLEWRLR